MNVVIIDDEPLARSIVQQMLKKHAGYNVIAECRNGFEGLKIIEKETEMGNPSSKVIFILAN